ncbi:hypothetical protein ACWEV3_01095 [Saccharopolyspora sp. NPDC003752]
MHHYNRDGRIKDYDFSTLQAAGPMQRSLAALFASRCVPHRWSTHSTSRTYWFSLVPFVEFLARQKHPPRDLDELTVAQVRQWRENALKSGSTFAFRVIAGLLQTDPRLQTGPVADELARRVLRLPSTTQSYSEAEFDRIVVAARRTFRTALLRIEENAHHLAQWHNGAFTEGSLDWVLGEGLDTLARTADLPKYTGKSSSRTLIAKYAKAFDGSNAIRTWQRLFLSRTEATALGVLLLAEYGWNLSVINSAKVPRASPDPGEDGTPTYRIPLEKARRGPGEHYETRNVTDDAAASRGRLITQALSATRFARAIVETLAPGTDRMIVWRSNRVSQESTDQDHHPPVGPFRFGVAAASGADWARLEGFSGSPFRRGRRTVIALDRREASQHSQDTHDRDYALVDKRVQADSIEVIAAGAQDAADRARSAFLVAELREEVSATDVETATADCSDFNNSPYPAPGGGCGASFLMCLACTNAHVHPGHHARLAHLHRALSNLRSVLEPAAWDADWGDAHARLEDLKDRLGEGIWAQALSKVTDADRDLIDHLLTGALDT